MGPIDIPTIDGLANRAKEVNMKAKRQRVLVVDDDDFIRLCIDEYLLQMGFEVASADNAEKGLEIFEGGDIDYAIIDYRLPNMDGLEMAKEIKQKNSKAIIIMISGELDAKFLPLDSIDHFLEKPFKFEEMFHLMTQPYASVA